MRDLHNSRVSRARTLGQQVFISTIEILRKKDIGEYKKARISRDFCGMLQIRRF